MNQLRTYNELLLDKRGWISKLLENKEAVILVSGGYDSMITAARLIKDYEMELFPIHIDRGSRNRDGELTPVEFFTNYFQKTFGVSLFHDLFSHNDLQKFGSESVEWLEDQINEFYYQEDQCLCGGSWY